MVTIIIVFKVGWGQRDERVGAIEVKTCIYVSLNDKIPQIDISETAFGL